MSFLKWSKEHSVYLPEIDAEHRSLFRLAAELNQALVAGRKPSQIRPILIGLLEAADEHFKHEERLMRVVHYSAFQWHKSQHDTIRKKTKAALRKLENGDKQAAVELLQFLNQWLQDHMGVADRMMGAFIRNYLRFNTALAS